MRDRTRTVRPNIRGNQMRALSLVIILMGVTGDAAAGPTGCRPEMLLDDITWCLKDAPTDVKGRETLLKAVETGRADAFMHGFAACQDDRYRGENAGSKLPDLTNKTIGNALACYWEDRQTLLRIAREVLGLTPSDARPPPPVRHDPTGGKP